MDERRLTAWLIMQGFLQPEEALGELDASRLASLCFFGGWVDDAALLAVSRLSGQKRSLLI